MTRKTALRRMLGGQKVYHSSTPCLIFKYDESLEKERRKPLVKIYEEYPEYIEDGSDLFFSLPNLGWEEYRTK